MTRPLANITREALEPLWMRLDIPTKRIAQRLGVTRQALSYKAKALGLPPRSGNQRCNQKADDETFTRMWMAGVNSAEMIRHFGYSSQGAISRRREILGLPPRTRGRNGFGLRGGWRETITLAQFAEIEMARVLRERGCDE